MGTVKKYAAVLATTDDTAYDYLRQMSKVALMETLAATIALNEGHCDEAPSIEELRKHCEPI